MSSLWGGNSSARSKTTRRSWSRSWSKCVTIKLFAMLYSWVENSNWSFLLVIWMYIWYADYLSIWISTVYEKSRSTMYPSNAEVDAKVIIRNFHAKSSTRRYIDAWHCQKHFLTSVSTTFQAIDVDCCTFVLVDPGISSMVDLQKAAIFIKPSNKSTKKYIYNLVSYHIHSRSWRFDVCCYFHLAN